MKSTRVLFNTLKLLFICVFFFSGCAPFSTSLEKSPVFSFEGHRAYNRVSLRVWKGNEIWFTNLYHIGEFIPAGTECTINKITKGSVRFTAQGKEYRIKEWLINDNSDIIDSSFEKYFVKEKEQIGFDNVSQDFLDSIKRGLDQVGMTKEEVLMCLGYPSHLGLKDPTTQYTREYILKHDEWYYLKSRYGKVTLIFQEGKLVRIIS